MGRGSKRCGQWPVAGKDRAQGFGHRTPTRPWSVDRGQWSAMTHARPGACGRAGASRVASSASSEGQRLARRGFAAARQGARGAKAAGWAVERPRPPGPNSGPLSAAPTSVTCDRRRELGGSAWESNPPPVPRRHGATVLKTARATRPRALPRSSLASAARAQPARRRGARSPKLTPGRALASVPLPGGAVAQLGERLNGIQEVDGSIPFGSTNRPWPAPRARHRPRPTSATIPLAEVILRWRPTVRAARPYTVRRLGLAWVSCVCWSGRR